MPAKSDPNANKFVMCVRCGRPIKLDDFLHRTWVELPPYCNMCRVHVQTEVAKNMGIWPPPWFGHARREVRPGGAIWLVDVFMPEQRRFETPIYNQFIEQRKKEQGE